MTRRLLGCLLALWILPGIAAQAAEVILDFRSELQVEPDASLMVTETIAVRAEGNEIRRGIYRDFPTDYRDGHGNRMRVGFDVLGVERDGRPEPFHTARQGNGVRVYMGEADRMVTPGEHSYRLRYRTDRQLGFFTEHDELYWNVTGNGWAFPIERASARVSLPLSVPWERIQVEGYTGPQGARGANYRAEVYSANDVRFQTTASLGPREGLTIVVSWPKGHVTEPTGADRFAAFAGDNREAIAGGLGLLLMLGWYLYAWVRVGRDPYPGPIAPLYEPPQGFSPASMRYIRRMGYDNKALAAALVNLAVTGYLRIEQSAGKKFILHRTRKETSMAPGEKALTQKLFAGKRDRIELETANHATLSAALIAHKAALKTDYEKIYFRTNSGWLVPGILAGLLTLAFTVLLLPGGEAQANTGFLAAWLTFWTLGVALLSVKVLQAWRGASGLLAKGGALFITLFALPFWAAEIFVFWLLATESSPAVAVVLIGVVGLGFLFYQLLKAPTLAGRRLLDLIEGFRLFLSVAEKDDLALRHPPEKTPELFERFLPYALALDVEQQWAERFAQVLAQAQTDRNTSYQPSWYSGSDWRRFGAGGFAGALGGSLSSAIASSSTAPGSSSGGGGGGSSGGGGGGGGGGGW